MNHFVHRTIVKAPLEKINSFHHSRHAFEELSPPIMFVRLIQAEPIANGSILHFRMWLGPIPVNWVAVHSDVSQSGFTDSQRVGPFEYWNHCHTFRSINSQTTEITDEIKAEPGRQLLSGLVSRLMWLGLPFLFGYRGWIIRKKLESVDR
jgi:ligand-binding SRPBCC domain-containing protein